MGRNSSGAGQAGPALSARLSRAVKRVALIERHSVGDSCVNTGCTPGKTRIASIGLAHPRARARSKPRRESANRLRQGYSARPVNLGTEARLHTFSDHSK